MEVTLQRRAKRNLHAELRRDHFTGEGVVKRFHSGVWPRSETASGPLRFGRAASAPDGAFAWLPVGVDPEVQAVSRDAGAIWFDGREWLILRLGAPFLYRERGGRWVELPQGEPTRIMREAVVRFPEGQEQLVLTPGPGETVPAPQRARASMDVRGTIPPGAPSFTARQLECLGIRVGAQLRWPPTLDDDALPLTEVKVVARHLGTSRQNVETLLEAVRAAAAGSLCPCGGDPAEDGYVVQWLVTQGLLDPAAPELQMQSQRRTTCADRTGSVVLDTSDRRGDER